MMMMMMHVVVWKRNYLEEWEREREKGDRVLVGMMKESDMISVVWVHLHLMNLNKRCAEDPYVCVCSSLLTVQFSVLFLPRAK